MKKIEVGKYRTKGGHEAVVNEIVNGWGYGRAIIGHSWRPLKWRPDGSAFCTYGDPADGYEIILTCWRDEIPWKCIRPEIKWVAWSTFGTPFGYYNKPVPRKAMFGENEKSTRAIDLLALANMPTPDCHWTETLTERPDGR